MMMHAAVLPRLMSLSQAGDSGGLAQRATNGTIFTDVIAHVVAHTLDGLASMAKALSRKVS
jgi:hypothetical protein